MGRHRFACLAHHEKSPTPNGPVQRKKVKLIRSVGAKLFFLPKYSPDLNPIEHVFAKLKHLLRKAATRTVEAVCAAIGQLLDTFKKTSAQINLETQDMEYTKNIIL